MPKARWQPVAILAVRENDKFDQTLEGEAGDAVGRDYYEHGAQPGQGYRNGFWSVEDSRGLTSGGALGIIKVIEVWFPRAARQR